jgi:hypothetical protein
MNKRFILEFIVGIILLVSVLIFGQKGMAALAFLAIHPFIKKKKKLDEREIQLFNKIGNFTAGATLLVSVAVYYFSDFVINGWTIGANWLFYVLSAFLISHGMSGLIAFNKK